MNKCRKLLSTFLITGALVTALMTPAFADTYEYGGSGNGYQPGAGAAEYTFEGESAGANFYQSTSTNGNYIADNGSIVVGSDGTISGGVAGNTAVMPLTIFYLPVGEYPEAYGFQTDVAIANNSIFPNELGPTSQNAGFYTPFFVPAVNSGALPTGFSYAPNADIAQSAAIAGMDYWTYYNYYYQYGAPVFGLATSMAPMPTITSGGAIGHLCIPSVGIDEYVYEGTSWDSMMYGIAHFDCTSGWAGNIGLAGHNRGYYPHFGTLKDVNIGDVVTYTTAYGTNTYVISNILTVDVTNTSGLQQNGQNQLTMYTCKADQPEVKLCVVATLVSSTSTLGMNG